MAEIMDVIRSHLDRETLDGIGKRVGADPSIVQRVAAMALPLLVGGLSRNVSESPQGRSSLNAALEHDHDGSLRSRRHRLRRSDRARPGARLATRGCSGWGDLPSPFTARSAASFPVRNAIGTPPGLYAH
jgi:hypothetical protein